MGRSENCAWSRKTAAGPDLHTPCAGRGVRITDVPGFIAEGLHLDHEPCCSGRPNHPAGKIHPPSPPHLCNPRLARGTRPAVASRSVGCRRAAPSTTRPTRRRRRWSKATRPSPPAPRSTSSDTRRPAGGTSVARPSTPRRPPASQRSPWRPALCPPTRQAWRVLTGGEWVDLEVTAREVA